MDRSPPRRLLVATPTGAPRAATGTDAAAATDAAPEALTEVVRKAVPKALPKALTKARPSAPISALLPATRPAESAKVELMSEPAGGALSERGGRRSAASAVRGAE